MTWPFENSGNAVEYFLIYYDLEIAAPFLIGRIVGGSS